MDDIEKLVVGAIVICSNRVLLLMRAEGEFMGGLVELPSGGVEAGESLEQALLRELEEETALADDVSLNHKEHADYEWLDISRVPFEKMNMSRATRKSITAALKLRETTAAPGCSTAWRDSSVAGRF